MTKTNLGVVLQAYMGQENKTIADISREIGVSPDTVHALLETAHTAYRTETLIKVFAWLFLPPPNKPMSPKSSSISSPKQPLTQAPGTQPAPRKPRQIDISPRLRRIVNVKEVDSDE